MLTEMTDREVMRRVVAHKPAPRYACTFNAPHRSDVCFGSGAPLKLRDHLPSLYAWGRDPELTKLVPDFNGEVCSDMFGNVLGRLGGITKGECVRGFIQGDWDNFDDFQFPSLKPGYHDTLMKQNYAASDKYMMVGAPVSVFSSLRDTRLMDNALTDTVLFPEMIEQFLELVQHLMLDFIDALSGTGIDAVLCGDDWGTQDRTFVSPETFRAIFKPTYKMIGDALHERGIAYIMHSCGKNHAILDDFIDAGVDVFQFDQPEIYPCTYLAENYGSKVAFWSPVDIQRIMPTGDRRIIEEGTLHMLNAFRESGSLIIKDYPSWPDIGVEEEWASWARDFALAHLEHPQKD